MDQAAPTYCPHLGLAGDRDLRCLFPDHAHRCFRDGAMKRIAWERQEQFCLQPLREDCTYAGEPGSGRLAHWARDAFTVTVVATAAIWGMASLIPAMPSAGTKAAASPAASRATFAIDSKVSPTAPPYSPTRTMSSARYWQSAPPAMTATPPPSRAVSGASATVARSGGRVHVVVQGETLSAIANRYDTSVNALLSANQLADRNYIVAGQQLIIP